MIKLLFTGDFYPQKRVESLIKERKFKEVFGEIETIVKNADYSVINLEAPVVINDAEPIAKAGGNMKCDIQAVEALRHAGFSLITLANNHFYDYGETGVKDTLTACKKYNIDVIGGGTNLDEARKILYKEIKYKTIAFINYCEHEFSIATDKSGGANPLNPVKNYYQILEGKRNADYVAVVVHGGHEHFQYPSPRMKETYRFFVDAGADVVINHHQHCFSGYEIYNGKPIFYGLGNFSFDKNEKRNANWNEGYMVQINFTKHEIAFDLIPYYQGKEHPGVVPMVNTKSFFRKIKELNNIIQDDNLLEKTVNHYYSTHGKSLALLFEPFTNRIFMGLRRRSLLPSFISKSKWLFIRNIIECESHRDKMIGYLKNN